MELDLTPEQVETLISWGETVSSEFTFDKTEMDLLEYLRLRLEELE